MKSVGSPAPAALAVIIILALESLGMMAVTGLLIVQLGSTSADTYSTAIALVVVVAIATAWITVTAIGFARRQPFAKGSALVWNILQAVIGVLSNQGEFARPDIGSLLLLPALAAIALLLFSKPVADHVSRTPKD